MSFLHLSTLPLHFAAAFLFLFAVQWPFLASAQNSPAATQSNEPEMTMQSNPFVLDAYVSFFPLYEMARLRYLALDGNTAPGRAEVNQFQHGRRLLDHTARNVTAPNNDTLYSSLRLDLRHGPLLIEIPDMGKRYYSLQFMNMYTDNVAILGQRNVGSGPLRVALVGPNWQGAIPAHSQRVDSQTNDMWMLVRTLVDGPQDLTEVGRLQDAMRVTAPQPAAAYPRLQQIPRKDPGPEAFFNVVNEMLQRNPPLGAMAEKAKAAQSLGLGIVGMTWSTLNESQQLAWKNTWPTAQKALLQEPAEANQRIGGWNFPPAELGYWGENYLLRARVALRGIAALNGEEALYLGTLADIEGKPLLGTQRYRVRVPPGGLPVNGFWSLTMYEVMDDGRFFLTQNPINRFSIGNRTAGLKANPDGSMDLLLQRDQPADSANWLPTPSGPFRLSLRAYLPTPALTRGELALPRVERVSD